jgi:hypothetical protein
MSREKPEKFTKEDKKKPIFFLKQPITKLNLKSKTNKI